MPKPKAMANGFPEAMVPAGPSPTEATEIMMVVICSDDGDDESNGDSAC